MTNTTATYWDVDGESLQTYAWNITTWGGKRQAVPPLRGEDLKIPHLPGALWQPKVIDSQTVEIAGWVIGASADGTIGDEQTFRDNWLALKRLLFSTDRQVQLTRRWTETVDEEVLSFSATGKAQLLTGMEPSMTGPRRAEFVAALHMADPFFYGTVQTVEVAIGVDEVVTIRGDADARQVVVLLDGPLTDAVLTASTVSTETEITYTGVVDGGTATITVDEFTATENGERTLSKLGHTGAVQWLRLPVGEVTLSLTASAGTGTATVQYREVWV